MIALVPRRGKTLSTPVLTPSLGRERPPHRLRSRLRAGIEPSCVCPVHRVRAPNCGIPRHVGSRLNREIERKFLVDPARIPADARQHGARFEQGYLAFAPSVRVRRSERDGADAEAWITIKGPGMVDRAEFEYAIPADDARQLLDLSVARLTKTRYRVPFGAHVWDLDEFSGAHHGLWLAEVELAATDEAFEHPPWLGDEVSGDARYANSALARAGRAP